MHNMNIYTDMYVHMYLQSSKEFMRCTMYNLMEYVFLNEFNTFVQLLFHSSEKYYMSFVQFLS